MYWETDITSNRHRILFTWVNYEDLGKRKGEKGKNSCIWVLIMTFSPQIWERGELFSITKYLNSSVFLPTSVNHAQDFMCLKYKTNLKHKLHPSRQVSGDWGGLETLDGACSKLSSQSWAWLSRMRFQFYIKDDEANPKMLMSVVIYNNFLKPFLKTFRDPFKLLKTFSFKASKCFFWKHSEEKYTWKDSKKDKEAQMNFKRKILENSLRN